MCNELLIIFDISFPSFVRKGEGEVEMLLGKDNREGLFLLEPLHHADSTPPGLPLQRGGNEKSISVQAASPLWHFVKK